MSTRNEQSAVRAQTKAADVSPDGACPTKKMNSFGYDQGGYRNNLGGFATELGDITTSNRFTANILLFVIVIFFLAAVTWAFHAHLDEVVRGMGKVIPSSEIKRIQNFEGGIIKEILVHEGQHVDKGQLLILLDQTQMTSRFREQQSGYLDQMLAVSRLEAELDGKETINFPAEVLDQKPHLIEHQRELMRSRNNSRLSALTVLAREKEQRAQELKELKSKLEYLLKNYALLKKEVDMTQNMVSKGAASDMDLLRAQRELTDLSGMIADARLSIPKVAAAL
ncbi:MAG: biotin/lipoyl-binding protein, partial [Desulfomicrobium sp.]|nr:biotin/lipoyl-binding protein [Desulfomicrobium sp.]